MKKILFIVITISTVLISCDKEDDTNKDSNNTSTLRLMMQHRAKDTSGQVSDIELDEMIYLNADVDTFQITTLKYYISNVKLFDSNGDSVVVPDSYYLFEQSTNQLSAKVMKEVSGIPAGTYTSIKFSVGVDSLPNTNDSAQYQVGDLDVTGTNGMPWMWAKGYKFVRLGGVTNTSGGLKNQGLTFHIGENVNFKTKEFTQAIAFQEGKTTMVHIMVMVHKLFSGSNTIDFDTNRDVQVNPSAVASQVADNYEQGMFMLHHTEVLN